MNQIVMFTELPQGGRIKPRRKPCKRAFRSVGTQLSFELQIRTELTQDDDDPLITAPIVHRTVSANGAIPLTVKAPASVWDMAAMAFSIKAAPVEKRAIVRVVRGEGVIRCVRIMASETQEYKEREIARRARQRPPRPTMGYKSMSKEFQALIS